MLKEATFDPEVREAAGAEPPNKADGGCRVGQKTGDSKLVGG